MYPQLVHMRAKMRGSPEVVALSRYLEDRVGQQVHFSDPLRPETLLKRLQTTWSPSGGSPPSRDMRPWEQGWRPRGIRYGMGWRGGACRCSYIW